MGPRTRDVPTARGALGGRPVDRGGHPGAGERHRDADGADSGWSVTKRAKESRYTPTMATPTLEPRRAGILEVAARAGVSRQTVTRAMNDMPGINAATKERVLEAARELRYRPSRFGRGL